MAPRQRLLRPSGGWHSGKRILRQPGGGCPDRRFTHKTHSERYNRKWDMQSASICQGCSVGCNISPVSATASCAASRTVSEAAWSHYFLCDRGRFGYGYVNLKTVRVSRFSVVAMTSSPSTPAGDAGRGGSLRQ
ncbi:hypothetical protein ACNKHQ_13610 [Shigella flexneri]